MTRRVLIASMLCLVVLGACSSAPAPQGDPDPGHRMLDALTPVLAAIPAGAKVEYQHVNPPKWDSCDGKQSTYGWDGISVDAAFMTMAPDAAVASEISKKLDLLGWRPVVDAAQRPAGDGVWTRTLADGATARAVLNPPGGGSGYWSLYAGAPPAAHPVTGC